MLGAVIAAGITSLALQGDYTYFGTSHAVLGSPAGWLAVPILGLVGGLAGGSFSRILILFGAGLSGRFGVAIARYRVCFAALCGLVVAGCGLLSHGAVFGTGYNQARDLVGGEGATSAWFAVLKMVATTASAISGIPGGIFAPSLAIGAGLGADVALILPSVPLQALAVLGMVAYFAGVVQAPITAFVIVAEMTNDHALVAPLMLTSLIACGASRLICTEGIYHALAHNFIPGGTAHAAALTPGGHDIRSGEEKGDPEHGIHTDQEHALEPGRFTVIRDRVHDERSTGDGEEVDRILEHERHRAADQPGQDDQQGRDDQRHLDRRTDADGHHQPHPVLPREPHGREQVCDRAHQGEDDHAQERRRQVQRAGRLRQRIGNQLALKRGPDRGGRKDGQAPPERPG